MRRRRVAAVLAPVAAGLAFGVAPAAATTVTDQRPVTYTNFAGVPVTCLRSAVAR